jgi:hypothetical protein
MHGINGVSTVIEIERYLGPRRSSCGTLIRKCLADTQVNARMDDRKVGKVGGGCVRYEHAVVIAVFAVCSLLHLHLGLSVLLWLVTESISFYTDMSLTGARKTCDPCQRRSSGTVLEISGAIKFDPQ